MSDPMIQSGLPGNEFDAWVVGLDPQLQTQFSTAVQAKQGPIKNAPLAPPPASDARERTEPGAASSIPRADAGSPTAPPGQQAAPGTGPVKASVEAEVVTTELPPYQTKYGKLTVSTTIKVESTLLNVAGSSGLGSSSKATLKDKQDGRTPGMKQAFSIQAIRDLKLFKGLSLTDVSVVPEAEISGQVVSVTGTFSFNIVTDTFVAPAEATVIIVKVRLGESPKVGGLEIKISPRQFKVKIRGVEIKLKAEFKVSFVMDLKKVGAVIVEKIAEKELKKAAVKQGVKMLSREAAGVVLKNLVPLALAFDVGYKIGELLNAYTVAPQVAVTVDEAILGDLNEQYDQASTFGKLILIYDNKERIIGALIASGVSGAAAGMADLVLFKLLGLDKLKAFGDAFKAFVAVLAALKVPNLGGAIADLAFTNAVRMGIKLNPKYHRISDPSFAKLVKSGYDAIHPLFKTKGGANRIILTKVQDLMISGDDMERIINRITNEQLNYGGEVDFSAPTRSVIDSFFNFLMADLLGFMQHNKLISYSVEFSPNLSFDALDPKLVAEVFA